MSNDLDKGQSSEGLPLRRLQLAFSQIIDDSIPFNLNAIQRHQQLIEECRQNHNSDLLMRQRIKGLQSVQKLKADLRQLESLAKMVSPNDYPIVGQQIAPIEAKVRAVVQQFLESNKNLDNPLMGLDLSDGHISSPEDANNTEVQSSPQKSPEMPFVCIQKNSSLSLMTEIMESKDTLISWLNLRKELSDLNDIFNTLKTTLLRQKEAVNSIENNVGNANENVLIGAQHLSKASALKSTFVPITAGLLGGAVFGPIGMMAGFKFSGVAAAVGASILSYSGVKFIQKKSITEEKIELISNETTNTNKTD